MNEHVGAGGAILEQNGGAPVQFRAAGREGPQPGQGFAQRTRARPRFAGADQRSDAGLTGSLASALSALLTRKLGLGEATRHQERSWASATFAGARHTLDFAYPKGRISTRLGVRCNALKDEVFDLGGHILADISVEEYGTKEDRKLRVEALTVVAG